MMVSRNFGAVVLAMGLVGCGGGTGSSPSSSANGGSRFGSTLSPGAVVELDACTADLSVENVDAHLAMVFDLEQSYHEMVACGGLVGLLANAVIDVIVSLAEDPSGGLPDGFERDGGIYTAAPGGDSNTLMTASFYYGDDYDVGAAGERIEYNMFALKSYLENPTLDIDYTTGELLIRYGARGPLVELLGFGPNPPRPLRLSASDIRNLTREIEKVRIGSSVYVDDERANSVVTYELASDRTSIGSLVDGTSFGFEAVSATAYADANGQDMTTLVWDLSYNDRSGGGLDGEIDFAVTGGDLDYQGSFVYRNDTWPEVSVRCMD